MIKNGALQKVSGQVFCWNHFQEYIHIHFDAKSNQIYFDWNMKDFLIYFLLISKSFYEGHCIDSGIFSNLL